MVDGWGANTQPNVRSRSKPTLPYSRGTNNPLIHLAHGARSCNTPTQGTASPGSEDLLGQFKHTIAVIRTWSTLRYTMLRTYLSLGLEGLIWDDCHLGSKVQLHSLFFLSLPCTRFHHLHTYTHSHVSTSLNTFPPRTLGSKNAFTAIQKFGVPYYELSIRKHGVRSYVCFWLSTLSFCLEFGIYLVALFFYNEGALGYHGLGELEKHMIRAVVYNIVAFLLHRTHSQRINVGLFL